MSTETELKLFLRLSSFLSPPVSLPFSSPSLTSSLLPSPPDPSRVGFFPSVPSTDPTPVVSGGRGGARSVGVRQLRRSGRPGTVPTLDSGFLLESLKVTYLLAY